MEETFNENFTKVFKGFVRDLIDVFPEYKEIVDENYQDILNLELCDIEKSEKLSKFMNLIDENSKLIEEKNEDLFSEDIYILENVSLKRIWSSKISQKTKNSLWKYLQTFTLLNVTYRANTKLKNALSTLNSETENEEIDLEDKQLVKDLKKVKNLSEEIQTEEVEDKPELPDDPLMNMIKNTEIGRIAEEVSKNIDMDSMMNGLTDDSGMSEVFTKMVSGGGIGKIFENIHNVVNEKVQKNEFSKGDLHSEATNIYGEIEKGNIPGMMNPGNMFKMMSEQMQRNPSQRPKPTNDTQERLRKKLEEKNKEN